VPSPRLVASVLLAVVAGAGASACSSADTAPVVATVNMTLGKDRAALGSPIDMTYEFDVAEGATLPAGYHVMVHVLDSEGDIFWIDDHDPPMPTEQWAAGTPIRYTRTVFIPLGGPVEAENARPEREYTVGTLELLSHTENILLVRGSGWYQVEFAADNPTNEWEWTEGTATLSFQNPRNDVTFYLEYDARPEAFDEPQQVTVRSGDQVIERFPADRRTIVMRRMDITAEQLGTGDRAELRLEMDKTFVPAEQPNGGGDTRVLGIRVYHAHVESR
jgi:hypothetical protein